MKADNKYMGNYDEHEDSSFFTYLDENHLYGKAKLHPMVLNGLKYLILLNVRSKKYDDNNSDVGYFFEVDIKYVNNGGCQIINFFLKR